ncbi:MAG: VOC family protein [Chloroflexi bacterium]|nr:VOC family protein [Chloroflexota bacterium]
MIKRLHHVMIAVRDLDESLALYRKLFGLEPAGPRRQARDGSWIVRLPVGDTSVMFVAPGKPGDVVDRFIEKRGEGLYSIGLEADDKPGLRESLKAKGVQMIGDNFIHPKSARGVLTEILAPGED